MAISSLRAHPRNYRVHPPDQLEHIKASIRQHGFYRNVVIAQEGTILAGHGVVLACTDEGITQIPVIRLPIAPDSPAALKVLAGDNEIGHLAEVDDRLFAEILREVKELDGLLGTGYDEMMLANLAYVTRAEIQNEDEAAAWAGAGMPDYDEGKEPFKLVVNFRTEEDREKFCVTAGLKIMKRETATWTTRWPYREAQDTISLRLDAQKEPVTA